MMTFMAPIPIPTLIDRLIAMNGGNAEQAALQAGTSPASLSRWRSGQARPRQYLEKRLRAIVDGPGDLFSQPNGPKDSGSVEQLEEAIARTLHALREEFHRTAAISTRQETLDLVAALVFAHVTSIDKGGSGISERLQDEGNTAVTGLNRFMQTALSQHLPQRNSGAGVGNGSFGLDRFFSPLTANDERFAERLTHIFEHDAGAFRALHEAGRDDLINEVFSRFMSISFVDEKEMGQYLTPPEITRFMVEVGFHALRSEVRARFLDDEVGNHADLILDPSCGVGSFLAETVRFFYGLKWQQSKGHGVACWLSSFVDKRVVGIDKSERMIRLAMINLGLFGAKSASLQLGNALSRRSDGDGEFNRQLEGRVQLILTNPPFGATYSGIDVSNFDLGRERAKADSEVLFLERYIDWLAPGGILVSVVPESVLVNRGAFAEVRAWLRARGCIEAVFSLPPVTFAAAGTSTKTSVLVLRKHLTEPNERTTYFGVAHEVGFDVITRSGQRRRIRNSHTDLPALLAEYRHERPGNLGRWCELPKAAERWDAAFHVGLPEKMTAVMNHPRISLVRVSDVAALVDERFDPHRHDAREFDYVEISDVDIRTGLVGHKRLLTAEAPSRARKLVRAGDVLMSTVRPERGAIGVTPSGLDRAVCSTGFAVLRCFGVHPFALTWLLKTELVRRQVIRNNIGIAYPAISDETCANLVLPATRESLLSLSASAEALAEAQVSFERTQKAFVEEVCILDQETLSGFAESGEIPDLVDAGKPGPVTDLA